MIKLVTFFRNTKYYRDITEQQQNIRTANINPTLTPPKNREISRLTRSTSVHALTPTFVSPTKTSLLNVVPLHSFGNFPSITPSYKIYRFV